MVTAGIDFQPTLTLGHIIEFGLILIGALTTIIMMRADIGKVKDDVKELRTDVDKLSEVILVIARQDEQIKSLRQRVERIEHEDDSRRPLFPGSPGVRNQ